MLLNFFDEYEYILYSSFEKASFPAFVSSGLLIIPNKVYLTDLKIEYSPKKMKN